MYCKQENIVVCKDFYIDCHRNGLDIIDSK